MAQYIFFDLDGTLTDSGPGIIHSVLYALERMGRPEPDVEKVRRTFIGPPLTVSFHSLYGYTPQQCQQAIAYFREDYNHKGIYNNRPYDGIPELLRGKPWRWRPPNLTNWQSGCWSTLTCGSTSTWSAAAAWTRLGMRKLSSFRTPSKPSTSPTCLRRSWWVIGTWMY